MNVQDFHVGDRVHHTVDVGLGAGTVERVDGRGVHVRFDAKSAARRHFRAVFDGAWFQQHPDGLKRVANENR